MSSIELLSPAGDWSSLKAAVSEGADAIYFGLESFNARRRAENFKTKELKSIVEYCHDKGVKSYLTVNTLVKNNELVDYFKLIEDAYNAGVDAVIIQDLAFIELIKNNFPDMEVHVSTQAGVFNSYYKSLIEKADRVILPREFSLKQTREFRDTTGKEIEVFVQGALCFSVSGQCLMSSFLGGRSGNRGLCAQPCRKKYNSKYLMSTRDLRTVEKLPEIIKAGVTSLKIEGRLRSPEYVGAATAIYRRALDSIKDGKFVIDENALFDLELAFNREYTLGGLFKKLDIVTPSEAGKRGIPLGVYGRDGFIKLKTSIRKGDGVGILGKKRGHGDIIRKIIKNGKSVSSAMKDETVRLFLNAREDSEIILTSGKQRRKEYEHGKKKKIKIDREKTTFKLNEIPTAESSEEHILVKVYNLEDTEKAMKAGADKVYYNIFAKDYSGGKVGAFIPRCLSEWNAKKALELIESNKPESILCADLGVATQIKDKEVYLDFSCNSFNDIDVNYYNKLGLRPVVSPELTGKELAEFRDKRFVVYSQGRIPLMTTKYKLDETKLKDEKGYTFPVRTVLDQKQVLNSIPLGLYNRVIELKEAGIKEFLLDLEEDVAETVKEYKNIISGKKTKKHKGEYTLGHYKKAVA